MKARTVGVKKHTKWMIEDLSKYYNLSYSDVVGLAVTLLYAKGHGKNKRSREADRNP